MNVEITVKFKMHNSNWETLVDAVEDITKYKMSDYLGIYETEGYPFETSIEEV